MTFSFALLTHCAGSSRQANWHHLNYITDKLSLAQFQSYQQYNVRLLEVESESPRTIARQLILHNVVLELRAMWFISIWCEKRLNLPIRHLIFCSLSVCNGCSASLSTKDATHSLRCICVHWSQLHFWLQWTIEMSPVFSNDTNVYLCMRSLSLCWYENECATRNNLLDSFRCLSVSLAPATTYWWSFCAFRFASSHHTANCEFQMQHTHTRTHTDTESIQYLCGWKCWQAGTRAGML